MKETWWPTLFRFFFLFFICCRARFCDSIVGKNCDFEKEEVFLLVFCLEGPE